MECMRRLTVYLLLKILACVQCDPHQGLKYKLIPGKRISSGATEIRQHSHPGMMTAIACARFCGYECGVFHFSTAANVCTLFADDYFNADFASTNDSDWTIGYQKTPRRLKKDGWTLVFHGQSGIGVKAYDTWINTGVHDDNPIAYDFPEACLRMSDYGSCGRHLRSDILDNWVDIQEVYMSWVKNNAEVAYMKFNGTDTDRDSWFRVERILNSTWSPFVEQDSSSLYPTSVYGYYANGHNARRFYLHGKHATCQTEWFYTYTVDLYPDWCDLQGNREHNFMDGIPTFLYSATNGRAAIAIDRVYPLSGKADVMAIWVKFAQDD